MVHLIKRFHYRLLFVTLIIGGFLLTGIGTPAFADTPTINGSVTAGTLTETASGSYSFSGPIGTTPTFSMPITVTDNTGGAAGWNLTITSIQFASGAHTLPATASTVTAGVPGVCTLGGTPTVNCMQSPSLTNTIAGPTAIPAAPITAPTAVKFFSIAAASASGGYTITPVISVYIPAVTFIASYSSVFTISIVSGP
jgi:hypothetical protein